MPLVHLGEGQETMKIHKDMMRLINMKSFFGALFERKGSAPVPEESTEKRIESRS